MTLTSSLIRNSTLFFFHAKYAILYIFKIVPVLLERIRNIHRILLTKIMLEISRIIKIFIIFSLEIINDFDFEYLILFFFYAKYAFCIFSRFIFQFYSEYISVNIHRIYFLLTKIMLKKRHGE